MQIESNEKIPTSSTSNEPLTPPEMDSKYVIDYNELVFETKLGEGSSGVVWKALYHMSASCRFVFF